MSTFKPFGAAALLLAFAAPAATPALAQQVISEPGYCAQFYPNANCQNKGPNNPYTGSYQRNVQNDGMWSGDQTTGVAVKRSRRSATRVQ
jgi:hypothetical protein